MLRSPKVHFHIVDLATTTMDSLQAKTKLMAVVVALGICVAPRLVADDAESKPDARIATLIRQLGADDFSQREEAARKLAEIGEKARVHLTKAAEDEKSPEISARAKEVLAGLDKAQFNADSMHVIGVYQAKHAFNVIEPLGRGIDWARLCNGIAEQSMSDAPGPGRRIWELLDADSRVIIKDKDRIRAIAQSGRRRDPEAKREEFAEAQFGRKYLNQLSQSLKSLLLRRDFYQEASFSGIELDKEGAALLRRLDKLSELELRLLNRRIFEASFPGIVAPTQFTLENATVKVHVPASPKSVNLVLCGYNSVRWLIAADDGAHIKNVIVSGYYPQDVQGCDARLHLIAKDSSESKDVTSGMGIDYFYAYEKDDRHYPELTERLRKLTGMEISSFQGSRGYTSLPCEFTIPSEGAK